MSLSHKINLGLVLIFAICWSAHSKTKKTPCEGYLCEYGKDPYNNAALKKKLNALITKKVGSDLGEGSQMTLSRATVDNYDAPASHEATRDAVLVMYYVTKPKSIMGNETVPNRDIKFLVIGEDVQLVGGSLKSWSPLPGRPAGGFCLWTPMKLILPAGTKFSGVEVTKGEVVARPYIKKPSQLKQIETMKDQSEFKYQGIVYKHPGYIRLKEDGTVFTKEEYSKLVKDYEDRYKKVPWLPVSDESGYELCDNSRGTIPDLYYDVRFSDTGGIEK